MPVPNRRAPPALLALAFLGGAAARADAQDRLVFPPGPIEELVARLPVEAPPLASPWPAWDDRSEPAGWGGERAWRRWVELVRAEARAPEPDPRRRVELALLARMQRRDADAWWHLSRAAADPSLVAAALPAFLPGVPLELLGSAEDLPDGVLLRPALPPALHDRRGSLRQLAGRTMEHRFVRVAGALLMMRVVIEGDGVQVDVTHREGPEVRLSIAPPVPPGVEIGAIYADWESLDGNPEAAELVLSADAPSHSIWGRFLPRAERWPAPLPDPDRPPQPREELVLVVPAERRGEPVFARFAEALAELYELPCELVDENAGPGRHLLEPVAIHLGSGAESERKLVAMIGLAEAWALPGR